MLTQEQSALDNARLERSHPAEVTFMVVMSPAHVADMLYGPQLAALVGTGAKALSEEVLPDFDSDAAKAALAQVEVLITGWGAPRLSESQLKSAKNLRYVLHAGGQASHFLPDHAERELQLSNAGWVNAIPVAEYTFAMILLANKQAFRTRNAYRERRAFVNREIEFPKAGNRGKVVGIVGASRIGRIVMERLCDIEVAVRVYDPYLGHAEAKRLGAEQVSLDELMSGSDIVSLHPPLNETTQGMITARHLALMKDGATLINTARGQIVDQEALVAELSSGRIDAVLDVTHPDVLPPDHPLYDLPNVFLTPHISGSMGTEIARMGAHVASELSRIVHGQPLAFPEIVP